MATVKGAAVASMLLTSGCFLDWIDKPEERHGRVDASPPPAHAPDVWDRHLHGAAPAGTRVAYRLGASDRIEITALEDGWVEVRDTREAPGVSRRRVVDGRVREAWYAEEPFASAAPQRVVQAPAGTALPGFEPLDGALVRVGEDVMHYEDALGFEFVVRTRWRADVPSLYTPLGGLVLRETPAARVELVEVVEGAAARVPVP